MSTISSLTRWFCSQFTLDELFEAAAIILGVLNGNEEVRLKRVFQEEHPNYRQYDVETTPPLIEAPEVAPPTRTMDWQELRSRHLARTGRELRPVNRRNGRTPPAGSRCEQCGAPVQWLSFNDGLKCSQLRCKVCKLLFPVRRIRRDASGPFWCPYCGNAMYEWKHNESWTAYKCKSGLKCPYYRQRYEQLNAAERLLVRTGMGSQFKLHYQWRSYHFDPATIRPQAPDQSRASLLNVRRSLESVGLALSYSVSLGMSSRMTSWALREIHGIRVSHQTVLNWIEAAAPLVHSTLLQRMQGSMAEMVAAADETYIKIRGIWYYTWFVIGAETRAIWAWNVSETRGEVPAVAVINQTLDCRDPDVDATLVLVGDGNPAYDAATNAVNTDADGKPLPPDRRKVERRLVVGLRNQDEQSEQFRVFKEMIERVNRTYRYHTRSRSGHKTHNGAIALTTLFVAHYDFLRPHRSLRNRPPLHLPELDGITTIQGKWLKLLQLAG